MQKIPILGTLIDNIDPGECIEKIIHAIDTNKTLRIVTANPEMIYQAQKEKAYLDIINSADLIVPDGTGVVWAGRLAGVNFRERVTGIDLTQRILKEGNKRNWRIFLLGSKPGVAEEAVHTQHKYHPAITFSSYHGYFSADEEQAIISKIKTFSPDVLLVGLGAPKQEYWLAQNHNLAKVSIGVGGTIDVLAGRVKRAPYLFQRLGLEWLYRLIKEPSRIRRQRILPLYVCKVLRQKAKR